MKIDGFDLKKQYGIRVEFTSPDSLLPKINTHLQELGTFGAVNYGVSFGTKEFSFDCIVIGENYHLKVIEFSKLFFTPQGKAKEVKLELGWLPNKYYIVTLSGGFELKPLSETSASFTLSLVASYPFSQSIYNTEHYFDQIPASAGGGNYLEIPVAYYGTYPTGIIFSMYGSLSYFDIELHDADGTKRVFHYVSNKHDTFMTMDFVNFTIDDNGSNGLPKSSGVFPEINSSTQKLIIRGDIQTSLNVQFREKYI